MPVIIPKKLPANETLRNERIFIMDKERAERQDIRPLEIALVNLMPTKIETETQILRVLSNSPIQINIEFIHTKTYKSKNTSQSHMREFYKTFDDIKDRKFDGMIITGAPVENMEYEQVEYWDEFKKIVEYSKNNTTSTVYICWGAQAALYHYYGIKKYPLEKKLFGVFSHNKKDENCMILKGFDDVFYVPHSRHTTVKLEDIEKVDELKILACSKEAGVHLAATKQYRRIFVMGHSEYDTNTLKNEYDRDIKLGKPIDIPINYYPDDDPSKKPFVRWRAHGNMFFKNWINLVYQETPFDINEIKA